MSNVPSYPKNPLLEEIHAAARAPAPAAGETRASSPATPPAQEEISGDESQVLQETVSLAALVDRAPIGAVLTAGCVGLLAGMAASYLLPGRGRDFSRGHLW